MAARSFLEFRLGFEASPALGTAAGIAEWIAVALTLFASAVVQAAVGFGFALLAIPLLLLAGQPLPQAIAVCAAMTATQGALQTFHFREHILWRTLLPVIGVVAATIPLGTWLLARLDRLPEPTVRGVVGVLLLIVLAAMTLLRIRARERLHAAWGLVAGASCGLLAGMTGTGGPPIVLWVMAHRWTNRQSRVAMWAIFLASVPFQFFWLSRRFPRETAQGTLLALTALPAALIGMAIGLWIGNRFSKDRLRQVALAVVVATALSMIWGWIASLMR